MICELLFGEHFEGYCDVIEVLYSYLLGGTEENKENLNQDIRCSDLNSIRAHLQLYRYTNLLGKQNGDPSAAYPNNYEERVR